jgi:hypothetical protein
MTRFQILQCSLVLIRPNSRIIFLQVRKHKKIIAIDNYFFRINSQNDKMYGSLSKQLINQYNTLNTQELTSLTYLAILKALSCLFDCHYIRYNDLIFINIKYIQCRLLATETPFAGACK